MFPCIKNVSKIINLAIKTNKFIIGYRVTNKFTGFIKESKFRQLQIFITFNDY